MEKVTSYKDATTYNNYYEFGTDKADPAKYAHTLPLKPWTVEIEGLADFPSRGLGIGEDISQSRQGARRGAADPPTGSAIPEDEDAHAGFTGFEAGNGLAVFDEKGAGLDELAHRGCGGTPELFTA